jgi:ribose 1,5-bisphosphokinase PhnN
MLSPVDVEYRRMLENRIPSLYGSRRYKSDVFLTSTKLAFQDFLRLVLNIESRLEVLSQRLNRMNRFNVRTMFERVDTSAKGWVVDTDVISFNFILYFCN